MDAAGWWGGGGVVVRVEAARVVEAVSSPPALDLVRRSAEHRGRPAAFCAGASLPRSTASGAHPSGPPGQPPAPRLRRIGPALPCQDQPFLELARRRARCTLATAPAAYRRRLQQGRPPLQLALRVSHPSVWARDGRGRGRRWEGRRGTVGEGGRGPCVAIGGPLKGDGPAATGGGADIRALTLAGRASRRPRDNSQTPRRKTRRLGKSSGRPTADSRRRMAGWRREAMDVAELRALGTNLAALGPLGPSAPSAAPTSAGAAR